MKILRDQDDSLTIEESLDIANIEKLDRYRIMAKLFDPKIRRYITNIKDNATLDQLVYMDTLKDTIRVLFSQELANPQTAPAYLSVLDMLSGIQDNYADWRMSIKAFRSKQVVEAVSSDMEALHKRRDAMGKLFTPTEKIQ